MKHYTLYIEIKRYVMITINIKSSSLSAISPRLRSSDQVSPTHVKTHKLLQVCKQVVIQICSQAVDKLCSHCLFPVVGTSC